MLWFGGYLGRYETQIIKTTLVNSSGALFFSSLEKYKGVSLNSQVIKCTPVTIQLRSVIYQLLIELSMLRYWKLRACEQNVKL